jgi:hypothetical protein
LGFSFVEIFVSLTILSLLFFFGVLRHGSEKSRADSEMLARNMVSDLKAAKSQAMATGRPVAVCWPSGGNPVCQSFYVMEGRSRGHAVRARDFSQDFREGYLGVGFWGVATVAERTVGSKEVDPQTWLPAGFKDYALIFDGQGKVATNDLPLQDGSYRILACSSLTSGGGNVSGVGRMPSSSRPGYYRFSKASAPHTIAVTPDGAISMTSGSPGLMIDTYPSPMADPAPPFKVVPPKFSAPQIGTVKLQARPVLSSVATVTLDGSLSISVSGTDPTGDDLFLEWSAEKVSGAATSAGYFSPKGRFPMDWNPSTQTWESQVSWVPPDDGEIGDIFDLSFVLSNSAGSKSSTGYSQLRGVELVNDDLFIGGNSVGLYKMHQNGTGTELIRATDTTNSHVKISPDGERMLWIHRLSSKITQVWTSKIDGTGAKPIANIDIFSSDMHTLPTWNERGTAIFSPSKNGISVMKADGSGLTDLLPKFVTGDGRAIDITSDGRYLAVESVAYRVPGDWSTRKRDLWIARLNQSAWPPTVDYWTNVSDAPGGESMGGYWLLKFQKVSPNPTNPVLLMSGPGSDNPKCFVISVTDTGSSFTAKFDPLTDSAGNLIISSSLSFSPDGTKVVGTGHWPNSVDIYDWSTASGVPKLVNKKKISDTWYSNLDWR